MKRKLKITEIIEQNINCELCKVSDVSESHRGHIGFVENGETHFEIHIISEQFRDLSHISRQRLLNNLLKEEFDNGLHSVSYRLKAKNEK